MRYRTSGMPFQIANRREMIFCFSLSLFLGWVLAYGFIPLSHRLFDWILGPLGSISFPLLALIFFVSLPDAPTPVFSRFTTKRLITLCVFPLLISAGFGAVKTVSIELSPSSFFPWKQITWTWLLVPLGEELLFRGWLTSLLNRMSKKSFLGMAPLYPMSLWGSAIAFSIWHVQNFESWNIQFLAFQVFYTFFVGLWLGFIKWQTGKLWPCFLAHALLNLTADWKLWFMV